MYKHYLRVCEFCIPGLFAGILFSVMPARTAAQPCNGHWVVDDPISAVNGPVSALVEMPNGDIAVSGLFSVVGTTPANNVAIFHPNSGSWSALGSGTNGVSNELQLLRSGNLIAGGQFSMAGGISANNIAIWNGSTWSALGSGIGPGGQVFTIQELANGDIIAGGSISSAGGINTRSVARWNGSAWSGFDPGLEGGTVWDISLVEGYEFVAGGDFPQTTDSVIVRRIAFWNGTDWVQVGAGLSSGTGVRALAIQSNGDLIAAGSFMNSGSESVRWIARWNGTTWATVVGASFLNAQRTLFAFPSSELISAAGFDVIRYNGGSTWISMPNDLSTQYNCILGLRNGDILMGGSTGITLSRWTDSFRPQIAMQPVAAPVCGSSASSVSIETTGVGLNYQWQVEGRPDLWRNLTTTPVQLQCGGIAYASHPQESSTVIFFQDCPAALINVRCALLNACGSATSSQIALVEDQSPLGDVNRDGQVSGLDIAAFVSLVGQVAPGPIGFCAADLDQDGVIDDSDIPSLINLLLNPN